jgi:outer membrane protein OmpA-like peptidoglycan-associated protein/uncharacterized membrane protein (UPF0127 family)
MPMTTNDRHAGDAGSAVLLTASGSHPLRLRRAASFVSRFCGLMLRAPLAPDAGLLLTGCPSVHTAFMRCAIDVVYLDAQGTVLKCVPQLRPWWGSISHAGRNAAGQRYPRAAHALELAAGSIARLGIASGSRLQHPAWFAAPAPQARQTTRRPARQRGAAIVELAVVAPVLTVLGLSAAQYSSLFFAKNQVNHAAFLAARAGSVGNASISAIKQAYIKGLVPMYGGGSTPAELAKSLADATTAFNGGKDGPSGYIEMLNPTKEAFEDWNDDKLQVLLDTKGKRVISNRGLGLSADQVRSGSGQSRQDANLIKLRIMQGVKPAVPVVGSIYTAYLKHMDTGTDANRTALINQGLIPVVTNVTMQMQSDAIEPDNPVSSPGDGNGGNPADPGEPPTTPPNPGQPCTGAADQTGCDLPPPDPGGGGGSCQIPVKADMSADALFEFDSATLSQLGKEKLASFMASYKDQTFDKVVITGYTDPLGSESYNQQLSERRAAAVSLYLNQLGLKVMDVQEYGKGATNPVVNPATCKDKTGDELKACYAPDRRVTIELTPHS